MMIKQQSEVRVTDLIGKGYNRFWKNRNFFRVVKGSRGSKKSKTTALWYIYHIMKYDWANVLVVRRFSSTNKQSTYTDLKWAAGRLGVRHLFKFNESLPEITYLPTGQKILSRGLDDPLKVTSITVDIGILSWLWVEEAYQLNDVSAFDTLVESIRGSYDSTDFFKQVTVTFNPWNEKHWLKREFFDAKTKRDNTFSTTTTFRVNEWLDDVDRKRYEDLYITNPRRARIVCDGEWGVAEGLIFDNWTIDNFDINQTIQRIGVTGHGMDFGFTHDPTTLPSAIIDQENKELYIYGELYKPGLLTKDISNEINKRNLTKTKIMADGAEPRLIAELNSNYGHNLIGAPKPRGSVMQGINYMKEFRIIVHPSCTFTQEELETYAYKQDKVSGDFLNEPEDDNNHIMDAIRYLLTPYHIKTKSRTNKNKRINAIKRRGL